MDRIQQKRTRGRDKSYHGLAATTKPFDDLKAAGNGQFRKRMDMSTMRSDSGCSRNEENSFAFDLRQSSLKQASETPFELKHSSSSKQAGGMPIKMLIAEEMSKDMEFRRRSPSVIARLMGLDALPPLPPVRKQKKPENYFQKSTSIGLQEKYVRYEGDHSVRMNSKEQQDFKDVYEVLETSNVVKHNNRMAQKGTGCSKLSEVQMAYIRQKFMDAKRLSTDEKLWESKEFYDALDVLDTNKYLFLKFLQEPDSLFTKHVHDLRVVPPPPQSSRITVLKSTDALKYENSKICRKSVIRSEERGQMPRDVMESLQKQGSGCFSHSHNKYEVYFSHKSSKSQFEGNEKPCHLPTRIVILKPGLGKAENMARAVSSPNLSASVDSSYQNLRENRRSGNQDLLVKVRDYRKLSSNMELVSNRPKSSREIAREITQQMRNSVNNNFIKGSTSGLEGYSGDESSYNMSVKDSIDDNEVVQPTSRHFYDWSNRCISSPSDSSESSVSKEAKKRLSERWKMTHKVQEVGIVDGEISCTLGEMLALPERPTRLKTLDPRINQASSGGRSAGDEVSGQCSSHSGISSRDGWKDVYPRNLTRSRSLPATSAVNETPTTSTRCENLANNNPLISKGVNNQGPDESFRGNFHHGKESSSTKKIKFGSKKSQSLPDVGPKNNQSVRKIHVSLDELRNERSMRDKTERNSMVPEPSPGVIGVTRQLTDPVAKCEDVKLPTKTHDALLPKLTPHLTSVEDGDSAIYDHDESILKETSLDRHQPHVGSPPSHFHVTDLKSPASAKEAEQPSPVSVLESPFVEEEVSSSECFERISADLQGLRMQLRLLKMESIDPCAEGSEAIVSSDDETIGYDSLPKEKENRDYSFLVNVLIESGFYDADREMLFAKWYSSEFPMDLEVFENVEKKYSYQWTWPKHERRLLFDLINFGLVDILGPCIDLIPWVKSRGRSTEFFLVGEELVEEVWALIVRLGKEHSRNLPAKLLGSLDLRDEVDFIGREMEKLLMDEVMEEVVLGISC